MKKVCIIGSGNWGSVIAKIVGENIKITKNFERIIPMYVFEEIINGQKLTDIINTTHENVKYLPGFFLPDNIVAVPDVLQAIADSDIIIFVLPHQFIEGICRTVKPAVKPSASAIHLIKGLSFKGDGVQLISDLIRDQLNIPCAVLMGANIADEVAKENFCEGTIGCKDKILGEELKTLFQRPYFRISVSKDDIAVELCGALKNVVAVGAGLVDGLAIGANTKAAIIRIGFKEIIKFCNTLFSESSIDTFLESCGFADLIATCFSGRNRKIAEEFVKANGQKTFAQLEKELLNGQMLQGPATAAEVYCLLKNKKKINEFPLFVTIHRVCIGEIAPANFIASLQLE